MPQKQSSPTQQITVPIELVERRRYVIRGQKVLLDRDLAELYRVETRALKQAVRRNLDRFPSDFMFELTPTEFKQWRSHFVTSISPDWMGLRYPPYAFTEQGVAMLSSVLKSKQAVQINILIMRAFVKLREVLATHKDLARKVEAHDAEIKSIWKVIGQLLAPRTVPKSRIGFRDRSEDKS